MTTVDNVIKHHGGRQVPYLGSAVGGGGGASCRADVDVIFGRGGEGER